MRTAILRSQIRGTHHLVRLILRRDRVRLPLWILGITAITAVSAQSVLSLYDTPVKRAGYGVTVSSSGAGKMMNGIPYDVSTLGGITAYETTSTATLLVALMVMFLVVRHTRAEEESGRAELLRATVTGRHAATAASVLVALVASAVVGVLDTLVFLSAGFDAQASLVHGASLAGVGLVFTSVAAAAAQVTSSARAALGIAGSVVALAFVVRGVGAISDSWLRLVSPFGWAQEARPFGDEKWGWFVLLLVVAALGLLLAAYLTAHRDAGAGLLQPRPGSPRASSFLSSPFGLALRLQRGLIIGWAVGLTLGAMLFGSLGKEVITMVKDNPEIAKVIAVSGAGILDGFFSYSLLLLAGVATAFTVSSVLRLRAEEDAGRAESVLSTGLSRTRWVLGSLALTFAASVLNLFLIGAGMGAANGLVGGDWSPFWTLVGGSLGMLPGVLLIAGVAVLLLGWLPRWSVLAWALFGFALLQAYLGDLLRFPDALSGVSPFWHLPRVPAEQFSAAPGLVVLVLALVLCVAGVVGVRRRDIG